MRGLQAIDLGGDARNGVLIGHRRESARRGRVASKGGEQTIRM
jgi:hypothetical protein